MERAVHLPGLRWLGKSVRLLPRTREAQEIRSAAFRTRSVASRQRDGFVAKEQFGVSAGRKDFAMPVLERERARDPGPMAPTGESEAALIVVKDASISHEKAAGGCRLEFAKRRDAVLTGHGPSVTFLKGARSDLDEAAYDRGGRHESLGRRDRDEAEAPCASIRSWAS